MFDSTQRSPATGYTTAIAFLVVGLILGPAILLISSPLGYLSISLASVCTISCVALAWVNWKRSSQLSKPAIATQRGAAK